MTPKKIAARHRLNAVFALGELRLKAEEIEHVGQRQRDHGEIDALTADGNEAHDQAQQCRARNPDQDAEFRWYAPLLHRMRREVGRSAEEGCVAKGQKAGIAEQQIKGTGKQREAKHLHDEDGIDEKRRPDHQNQADHQKAALD